ncbi:asparaginase [Nonomuraea glycinis]|uniref:Asparaginase n=1 Tax=Nonomuraea glycinis TaxID=2047744 RepID=A0A918ABI2_9ACTN|nr:asparaginase [Nonomuraea glycinis]MCA2180110.1 asparaginase [Nonomuraea glycinis]GGP10900.1 asparaginase [Nonomuraea glycinis]
MSLVVEVVRSGFVESRHQARMLTLDATGTPVAVHGAVHVPASPRSSMKPLQALGMLRAGLGLSGELLALACASHAGEPYHVEGVRRILAGAGLGESALRCPEDYPEDRTVTDRGRVYMNCSGKHAAMLATCVRNDWPLETYLEPPHPLQRAIRATVEELTGERVLASGVDGCGAPLFFISMLGVARAFAALALSTEDGTRPAGTPVGGPEGGSEGGSRPLGSSVGGPEGSAEGDTGPRAVFDAMRTHPEWTSGTHRPEAALMRALPGLLVKAGAEGFQAFVFEDGRAGVIKVEDGAGRGRTPLTVAALRTLGLTSPELDALAAQPVLGGGRPVGELRVR